MLGYWRGPATTATRKTRLTLPGPEYRVGEGDTLLIIGVGDAMEKFLGEP